MHRIQETMVRTTASGNMLGVCCWQLRYGGLKGLNDLTQSQKFTRLERGPAELVSLSWSRLPSSVHFYLRPRHIIQVNAVDWLSLRRYFAG